MKTGKTIHLPVYGLYVAQADDVKLENVRFTLRPGTTDARPATTVPCR